MKQSIALVSLVVRDYDEALAFYVGTLGFELIEDTWIEAQQKRWVVVAPPGPAGTRVLLARAANTEQTARVGNQTGGRVFLFLHTDDLARDLHAYKARGVVFVREARREPYGTVAVFADLYGNLWDLIEPDRSAAQPAAALPAIGTIGSPRLTMRPVAAADLADLLAVNGDPQVTAFLPYATWQSLEDGAAWLVRMEALAATGTGQQLVLVRKTDGKVIGTVLLFRYDEGSRRLELGYVLGRSHWGQGLMREALDAVCAHALAALNVRRIEAEVNPINVASCRLLQRLGFTLEGTLRQRWMAKGASYDVRLYGLLAGDWRRCADL